MRVLEKAEALELLRQSLSPLPDGACPMCALVSAGFDGWPAIAENEHALAVLNRFGQRRAHLMVIARTHVEHVHQLEWPAYAGLQKLAHQACAALNHLVQPERVFVASLGRSVSMNPSYAHLHVHIIPIYESDERARPARVLSWGEGVVVYDDDEAGALIDQLRAAWPAAS